MLDRNAILKSGFAKIVVTRSGVRSQLTFTIMHEQSQIGSIPYLCTQKDVDLQELVRIAAEANLPVRSKSHSVFPEKKSAHDFAGL
jgi:hypothetical protein